MRVLSTATMNRKAEGYVWDYIAESEGHYIRQTEKTAEALAENADEAPVILISGPSGSGKTTTAFRIKKLLCEKGFNAHVLSMDNYFLPVHDPRNEKEADGSIDFESPKRLDKELISEHLEALLNGEEFTLPVFDFANQRRLEGKRFHRQKHELVILEGIHALNPDVTGRASERSAGVYVSVRTRMKNKKGALLHPSKIRLMRRLVRDKLFRGRGAAQTFDFFEHVQLGEKKYILPYKGFAEHNIDTFIAYEAAAYKKFLLKELEALKDLETAFELLSFLTELTEVDFELIPLHSLVREFTGGSEFEY